MLAKSRLVTLMPIKKMDRAIKFYTGSLGAKLLYRGQGEMKDMWAAVKVADHEVWLITPEKREKRELSYTSILTKNIRKTVKELAESGVKFQKGEKQTPETVIEGPIMTEAWGSSATFKDSEGNLLMLWQNNPPM